MTNSSWNFYILKNCQAFGVYPKFTFFNLPNISNTDTFYIRKRLLRTSILRRIQENKKFDIELGKWKKIDNVLNSTDFFILKKVTQKNVERKVNDFINTHEKKLKALTRNSSVPFTHKDTMFVWKRRVSSLSSP